MGNLPLFVLLLAYSSVGICLGVSAMQMNEIFGDFQSKLLESGAPLLAFAILFGTATIWRILGHMISRKGQAAAFYMAMLLAVFAGSFGESISIATSSMSLIKGVNEASHAENMNSSEYKIKQQTQLAASQAASKLTASMEALPDNYVSLSNKTADKIIRLTEAQTKLNASMEESLERNNSVNKTLADIGKRFDMTPDDVQWYWSICVAFALTIFPLTIMILLGVFGDSLHQAINRVDLTRNFKSMEDKPTKKPVNLQSVK